MPLHITPFERGFGAEISGIASNLDVSDGDFRGIQDAWIKHSILLFRDLQLTPADHVAFTRRLGELHVMKPLKFNLEGFPEVFVVSNASKQDPSKPVSTDDGAGDAGLKRAGEGFHTDGEDKRIPNAGSFLYARRVPPERGDTLFVDMYAVYQALPPSVQHAIAGRRVRYSRIDLHSTHYPLMDPLTDDEKRDRPDVYHPLTRKHPVSGRTSLYIGRWARDVEGVDAQEGRALIRYLQTFAQQARFIHTHKWLPGDAVLWDNRCTQHCATGFDDAKYVRTMYRTTLEGDVPIMAQTLAGIEV
jgi:taurine dioxygenase